MSLHRVVLVGLATLFTAGASSAAFAGCCGWGAQAPVAYATVGYPSAGCGGCGTPTAAVVYAQPVAPAPMPVVVGGWGGGCGHCGGGLVSYAPAVEAIAIAPAPIYVVNQGPDYTGPGIMAPFHTWMPSASYVAPGSYPYFSGYGAGWRGYGYARGRVYGRRYGYGARFGYGVRGGYIGARRAVYRGGGWGRPAVGRVYR